jgi:hypothetical protein
MSFLLIEKNNTSNNYERHGGAKKETVRLPTHKKRTREKVIQNKLIIYYYLFQLSCHHILVIKLYHRLEHSLELEYHPKNQMIITIK